MSFCRILLGKSEATLFACPLPLAEWARLFWQPIGKWSKLFWEAREDTFQNTVICSSSESINGLLNPWIRSQPSKYNTHSLQYPLLFRNIGCIFYCGFLSFSHYFFNFWLFEFDICISLWMARAIDSRQTLVSNDDKSLYLYYEMTFISAPANTLCVGWWMRYI